jgi:hypothetical protein
MRRLTRALVTVLGLTGALSGLAGAALAQGSLSGALDRQERQQVGTQIEVRREAERQSQDLQRQLDLGRVQQQIDRQQMLRQAPVPCPFSRPNTC